MAADKPRPLLQNSLPGDANLRFLKDRSDLQKAPRSLRLSHAFWVAIDLPQYFVLGVTNKSTHWIRWDSFLYPIFRSRVWFWMGFPWIPWIFQLLNSFRVAFDRLLTSSRHVFTNFANMNLRIFHQYFSVENKNKFHIGHKRLFFSVLSLWKCQNKYYIIFARIFFRKFVFGKFVKTCRELDLWLQTRYRGFELGPPRFGGLEVGHWWAEAFLREPIVISNKS